MDFVSVIKWFYVNGDLTEKGSFVIAILLSILSAFLLKQLTKASLNIHHVDDEGDRRAKYIHVNVSNEGRFLFLDRETAFDVTSAIVFIDLETQRSIGPFSTKWATKPNPISPHLIPREEGAMFVHIPDETKIGEARVEDIPGGTRKMLDVAVKYEGDAECYVHTPENFFHENMRPPNHRLNAPHYEVIVTVQSVNSASVTSRFILHNAGNSANDLTLEPLYN